MPVYDEEKKLDDKQLKDKEKDALEEVVSDFSPEEQAQFGALSSNDLIEKEGLYHPESLKRRKSTSFIKNHKKLLIFGGGSGLILIGGIFAIMVLLSSLGIQNLATHVAEYNMLRSVRTFRQSSNQIISEKFTADVTAESTDGLIARTKAKYGELRSSTWGKLDRFRPQQLIDNLHGDSKIQYVYSEVERKIIPGKRLNLTAVIVDGQRINLPETSKVNFFGNTIERLRFGRAVDNALAAAIPEAPSLARAQVTKDLMRRLGFRYQWWPKSGAEYRGLDADDAFTKQQQESTAAVKEKPTSSSVVPDVNEQVDDSTDELADKVDDGTAEELNRTAVNNADEAAVDAARLGIAEIDDVGEEAIRSTFSQTLKGAFQDSLAESAIRSASTAYQIAMPICIIYDGSIVRAGSSIDAKNNALMRTELGLQAAADQQKAGKTTGEAVGAMRAKLGNVAATIPEARARGEVIDTKELASGPDNPQSGVFGDTTIVDVFGGESALANFINKNLETVCPKILSSPYVAAGVLLDLGLTFLSGGSSSGATTAASRLATEATEEIVTTAIRKTLVQKIKSGAFGVLKKAGRDLLTFGSLTIGAKLLTIQYANAQHDGLSTSGDFAMEADMGGNLRNSETLRRGMYGRTMTTQEVQASKVADANFRKNEFNNQGSFERYFALNNPDSLLTKTSYTAMARMPNLQKASSWLSSNLIGAVTKLFSGQALSHIGNILSGHVGAASGAENFTGDYNIIQWGWTEDELALIRDNPEYSLLANAEEVASRPAFYDAIAEKYNHCFTDTMGTLIEERDVKRNDKGEVSNSGECSPEQLSINNPGSVAGQQIGDGVFRWRLSKLNESMLDHLLGIQQPGADAGPNIYTGGEGVKCPSNLEPHPTQPGYFKMPDAPNGEYDIVTSQARRYGSKQLVCVLYTVGINYSKLYPGKSKLMIGDLNASGHQSHYRGIAVDLNAGGEIAAADRLTPTGTYSTEATIALGKMFVDTKSVASILWCEPGASNGSTNGSEGSMNAIRDYAKSKGQDITIKCIAPNGVTGSATHANHFHVNLDLKYALPGRFTP